ncbi:hypothetical protein G6F23_015443 [Rhizopus arrhizus]|nr:hypothetical protein G6F23_015443 [Rhizopus arrhizus]
MRFNPDGVRMQPTECPAGKNGKRHDALPKEHGRQYRQSAERRGQGRDVFVPCPPGSQMKNGRAWRPSVQRCRQAGAYLSSAERRSSSCCTCAAS